MSRSGKKASRSLVVGVKIAVVLVFSIILVQYACRNIGLASTNEPDPYDFVRDSNGVPVKDENGDLSYNDGAVHELHGGQHQNCDICASVRAQAARDVYRDSYDSH